VLDGKDEDATLCPKYDDYEELLQSTDCEDLLYYVDDENGSRVLAHKYDMDLTTHPIYDMYDDARMIVPKYEKDWEIHVEDDNEGTNLVDKSESCMRKIVHVSPIIEKYYSVSQMVPCVTTNAKLMK